MKKIGIILDTNYFLHFKGIDSIPWKGLLGAGNYFFLITDPLIKELDNQKFNKVGKLRERAEKAIRNFFFWFDTSSSFSLSTEMHITQTDILKIDFEELNLNKDDQDDNFIAYAIEVSKSNDYDEVFLLSNDFGMHRKAKLRNLKTIRLNEEHKLPPPQSELEKENANLKNELLKLHNRQPKLKILFENDQDYIEHKVQETFLLSDSEKQEIYKTLCENYPYSLKGKDKKHESNSSSQPVASNSDLQEFARNFLATQNTIATMFAPTTEQLQKYDEELDQYFKNHLEFEVEKRIFESRKNRSVLFQFQIKNNGGAMATNVQVNLHLPVSKQCELLTLKEFEASSPEEPNPPRKPNSSFGNLHHILGADGLMPTIYTPRNVQTRNVSRPTITPTNSFDIDFSIENLLHHTSENSDKMVLIFPSIDEATSFTATYSLICPENPELTKGTLHFNIKRSTNAISDN